MTVAAVPWTVPVVALTVMVYIPWGVPGLPVELPPDPPPQDASQMVERPSTTTKLNSRKLRVLLFLEPKVKKIPTSPGSSMA